MGQVENRSAGDSVQLTVRLNERKIVVCLAKLVLLNKTSPLVGMDLEPGPRRSPRLHGENKRGAGLRQ